MPKSTYAAALIVSCLLSMSAFAAKKPLALLINLTTESFAQDANVQTFSVGKDIRRGFTQAGFKPKILGAYLNGIKRLPKKERLEKLFQRIDQKILKQRNSEITHIFLLGHGAASKDSFLIGDLEVTPRGFSELFQYFGVIRDFSAKKVKVFIASCSIFGGNEEEALSRAHRVRRLLKDETDNDREVEVFGYRYPVTTSLSSFFYTHSYLENAGVWASIIGMGALKALLSENGPTIKKIFTASSIALALTPLISAGFTVYGHYIKNSWIDLKAKSLIFFQHQGMQFNFKGQVLLSRKYKHDSFYFLNDFAHA